MSTASVELNGMVLKENARVRLKDGRLGTVESFLDFNEMWPQKVVWPLVKFDVSPVGEMSAINPELIAEVVAQ